ncbi:hypothetical protein [Azotobacter chroococcum]|uniref:Uncharacterized protein n=1 Tax=Azotobacter chroococcum TaxID=353 RepID=A0AAP9YH50_9GAMM|nr:hypothetical protein [Azotobacter chroococcum]QQE90097.1 hypothetical protein GKQ51_07240 [Azotobacter chroococcum]
MDTGIWIPAIGIPSRGLRADRSGQFAPIELLSMYCAFPEMRKAQLANSPDAPQTIYEARDDLDE